MLKRLFISLAILAGLAGNVQAAGTVPGFSLTPQFDKSGKPMPGCKLNVIQAGTTSTPQIAYQDSALTIPAPGGSQLVCDASARLPQFFLADGQIKFRLTDKNGFEVFSQDNLLVVGPSTGGGGGGGQVDPTTVLATGDLKVSYGTGTLSGFVRANGRTIGSATSGATERASADAEALFNYLWQADSNLVVSSGRGVSSAADWSANKTIALPDWRGRALAGLDDMGNSAAGRLTSTYFGATATVLGAAGGAESQTLTTVQLPAHFHGVFLSDPGHSHGYTAPSSAFGMQPGGQSGMASSIGGNTSVSFTNIRATSPNGNDTTFSMGSNVPHPIMPPTMLATIFIKL